MITADRVTVRYGDVTAVHEASLDVPAGRVVAVSGPSGAGKTSLLWAIAGILTPAAGTVLLNGRPVRDRGDAAGGNLVLIPQGNGLARSLTARENILMPLLAHSAEGSRRRRPGRTKASPEVDDLIRAALADVGLEDSGDHLVEELSGGEQQRVAVARGLVRHCDAVLADEPTSELDGGNRERVLDLLSERALKGAAVVVATHDPEVAARADAHAVLDEGRLTWARPL